MRYSLPQTLCALAGALLLAAPDDTRAETSEWAARTLLERGERARQRGRTAEALRHFNDARSLAPQLEAPYRALARLRQQAGDTNEARSLLLAALERHPKAHDSRRDLAELEYRTGHLDAAIEHLWLACQVEAAQSDWVLLASWYVESRNYTAALTVWRRLLHGTPAHPDAALSVAALKLLADQLDPVRAGRRDSSWVRRSLAVVDTVGD